MNADLCTIYFGFRVPVYDYGDDAGYCDLDEVPPGILRYADPIPAIAPTSYNRA